MYHVLLAVAGDDERVGSQIEAVRSLPEAASEVEVTVFHCFGENPSGASVSQVGSARRARDELEAGGVTVHLDESSGDPAEAIIDAAERCDVDAICLAGRKRTPAGKVLFGSVTQGVILGTDRPVIVCG
ncbi:universal stress protein [Natronorarus salvus]|uniref:universal stress protein n=1 Tax=Natronorarus salvus TaxID=3117733 RepID=UPI002F267B4F